MGEPITITLPGDIEAIKPSGLLEGLHYTTNDDAGKVDQSVDVTFDEDGNDYYRFAQRFLRQAEAGYLYDMDGAPGNGDEIYLTKDQINACEITEDREVSFGDLRGDQDEFLPRLSNLHNVHVPFNKLCSVLVERLTSHKQATKVFVWDSGKDARDFYTLPEEKYDELREILDKAELSSPYEELEDYGRLRLVDADRETADFYVYRAVLTDTLNGKTGFFNVQTPAEDGVTRPRDYRFEEVAADCFQIPSGWQTPGKEAFSAFVGSHPQYLFYVAYTSTGKPVPFVAIPALQSCGYFTPLETQFVDLPMTEEEAVKYALSLGITSEGGDIKDFVCEDIGEKSQERYQKDGKKYYRFQVHSTVLVGYIEHLQERIEDAIKHNSTVILPGKGNHKITVDEAKALMSALENFGKGDKSAIDVFIGAHPLITQSVLAVLITVTAFYTYYRLVNRKAEKRRMIDEERAAAVEAAEERDYFKEFGENLSESVRSYKEQPTIGRDEELSKIIKILTRNDHGEAQHKSPNTPALTGLQGVGKSDAVEGLAWLIEQKDPRVTELHGYTVMKIDLGSVAGGEPGGSHSIHELPGIVRGIIRQAIKQYGKVIIFVDEVHRLMEIGKHSKGDLSIAEDFKEAMGRGQLKLVVATTTAEFQKYVKANAAFLRRVIEVGFKELGPEALQEILSRRVRVLTRQTSLTMAPDVLRRAIEIAPQAKPDAGAQPACSIEFVLSLFEDKELHNEQLPASRRASAITMTDLDRYVEDQKTGRLQQNVDSLLAEVRDLHRTLEEGYGWPIELPEEGLEELADRPSYHEVIRGLRTIRAQLKRFIAWVEAQEMNPEMGQNPPRLQLAAPQPDRLSRPLSSEDTPRASSDERETRPIHIKLTVADLRSLFPNLNERFADPAAAEAAILNSASEAERIVWKTLYPGELKPASAAEIAERMEAAFGRQKMNRILPLTLYSVESREVSGPALGAALFRAATAGVRSADSLARDGEFSREVRERYVALLEAKREREPLTRREERRLRVLREGGERKAVVDVAKRKKGK